MRVEKEQAVVTIGLPDSGKTTFLAALWHLIKEDDIDTRLKLHNLRSGELAHLNAIAERWRSARIQDRTTTNNTRLVDINLRNEAGKILRLTFPDVAGESYRQIWEQRECDKAIAEMLDGAGVLLFIHADRIRMPVWIADNLGALMMADQAAGMETELKPWGADMAPTQVKMVGLLSSVKEVAPYAGTRRLAVMLSAWDKAKLEKRPPNAFLASKMPLLDQYLRQNADTWEVRVYGVSAQGGDYDPTGAAPHSPEAEILLAMDNPSQRIQLVFQETVSHDLTEPLEWLMG